MTLPTIRKSTQKQVTTRMLHAAPNTQSAQRKDGVARFGWVRLGDLDKSTKASCALWPTWENRGQIALTGQPPRSPPSGSLKSVPAPLHTDEKTEKIVHPVLMRSLHTVDFFKAGILDMDPFLFGQVSAIHAISDIFAMGIANFFVG